MVTAFFCCKECGIDKMQFRMRNRGKNEDVVSYVHACVAEAAVIHCGLKPGCLAKTVDVGMPITQNGIGFPGPRLTDEEKASIKKQLS